MLQSIKSKTLLFLLLFSLYLNGQTYHKDVDAYSFSINNNESIEFLIVGKDVNAIKPTIIFCQGSLPIPLIIHFEDGRKIISSISNFDYKEISEKYNIVLISMPFTPLEADEKDLNNQFAYITDTSNNNSYSQDYLDANYLDKYVERGNVVIDFLLQQDWVNPNSIYIVGHSQGAKVATKIASSNEHIAALGFLGGNPLGRIDQFIREYRLQEAKGILTKEEAQTKIEKTYEWWNWLNENIDQPSRNGEDSPRTSVSFSQPVLSDLINLKTPVFVGYGTSDITSSYCDILPIDFIREGKSNYKHKPYLGLEHNFFELDKNGKPDYDKGHWNNVMNDFIDWLEMINKD